MNQPKKNRREFLATVGSASAASIVTGSALSVVGRAAESQGKLAIDGGTPVRKTPLHHQPYGPQFYNETEKRELLEVLESRRPFRWWNSDSKVLEFEEAYAKHIGTKYALGVTSGTTALSTALAALEIGPGDEVILPAWTWYADYDTVVLAGALPVFAEVDASLNIDPNDIESRITPRTKAIIAVSLQGCPADMDPILTIARKHNLRVLEDFSQCVGGRYRGKYLGSMGDIGISSFQESKTITAGEGGAVVTNDAEAVRACGARSRCWRPALSLRRTARWRCVGRFRRLQLPNERIHGRDSQSAGAGPGYDLCGSAQPHPEECAKELPTCPACNCGRHPTWKETWASRSSWILETDLNEIVFFAALRAEGISASGPGGSVILPIDARVEQKQTVHPDWPSFNTPHGKAMRYGADCCPRTIDIIGRMGGVIMDPNFTDDDVSDIIAAIRKVYSAMHSG